jgi:hypothetical protein
LFISHVFEKQHPEKIPCEGEGKMAQLLKIASLAQLEALAGLEGIKALSADLFMLHKPDTHLAIREGMIRFWADVPCGGMPRQFILKNVWG